MSEVKMYVGVTLRMEVLDLSNVQSDVVKAGGALRAEGENVGIISFLADLKTEVIGDAVTNVESERQWSKGLLLPGSSGAKTRNEVKTELKVFKKGESVAFRTVGHLSQLGHTPSSGGEYVSPFLDVFATTG